MKMTKVTSSNIRSVGYDELKMKLRVFFYSGGTYEYTGVPRKVWMDFIKSESLGKYFFRKIKNKYSYAKISN